MREFMEFVNRIADGDEYAHICAYLGAAWFCAIALIWAVVLNA